MTSKRGANKTGYHPVSGLKLYFDIHNPGGPAILPRLGALTSTRTISPSAWWGGLVWTLLVTAILDLWDWIERARILTGAV
jgi:hypothetical protein